MPDWLCCPLLPRPLLPHFHLSCHFPGLLVPPLIEGGGGVGEREGGRAGRGRGGEGKREK